jgi:putative phosphoribosyl transferase
MAFMISLPFSDRTEAGRQLAASLALHHISPDAVVLALARGGVPIGLAVADRLHLPLDVVVARKLGVPWQPELAMGALAGGARVLDETLIRELGIAPEDVAAIVDVEQEEMSRREGLYRQGRPAPELRARTAILVDDGLATGSTMLAAIRHLRSLHPAKIMVAVPVGSEEGCGRIRKEADDFVCLVTPELFFAVGEWYRRFPQVTDSEVRDLLAESRKQLQRHPAGTAV